MPTTRSVREKAALERRFAADCPQGALGRVRAPLKGVRELPPTSIRLPRGTRFYIRNCEVHGFNGYGQPVVWIVPIRPKLGVGAVRITLRDFTERTQAA